MLAMRVTAIGFVFLIQIMLTRLLTVTEFGAVQLILTAVVIAGLFLQAGTGKSLVKMIVEKNDLFEKRSLAGSFIVAWCCFATLILITAWIVYTASEGFENYSQNQVVLIAVWIISYSFILLSTSIMRAHFQLKTAILLSDLLLPSVLMIILGANYLLGRTINLDTVIFYYVAIASLVALLCLIMLLVRNLVSVPSLNLGLYKIIVCLSFPIMLLELSHLVFNQGAIWLVGAFGSLEEVALFAIAYKLTDLIVMPSRLMTNLIEPTLVVLKKQNDQEKFQDFLYKSAWLITLPGFMLAILFILFGKLLISIAFGPDYIGAYDYLWLLALVRLTGPMLNGFGQSTLIMTGYSLSITTFELLIGLMTLSLMIVVGYYFSVDLLIYTLAGCFLVRHVMLMLLCRKISGYRCQINMEIAALKRYLKS